MKRQNLNIGIVGPLPPPSGGMANQTRQLARLLQDEGIQVEIIQTNEDYKPRLVKQLPGIRAIFRLLPYIFRLWNAAGKVDLFHVMANSGWSWHLFASPAIWIAKLRNTPVVMNYRGGEVEAFFTKSFFWIKPTLNQCQRIIVPSNFLKLLFEKWQVNCKIVPNVIDTNKFSSKHDAILADDSKYPHIVITRNLEKIYGIDIAIRVIEHLKKQFSNIYLSVAGSGPEHENLTKLVNELSISDNVQFVGRVDNDEIMRLYHSADLMLNTSLVDNTPNSILEAMACGVPVISTSVGGIPHMITNGHNGVLVDSHNPIEIAYQIGCLLENKKLYRKYISNGYDYANQFTWDKVKLRLFNTYDELLNQTNVPNDI